MAASISDAHDTTVELISGDRGEFSIWVGDEVVAQKTMGGFPDEPSVLHAVQQALRGYGHDHEG